MNRWRAFFVSTIGSKIVMAVTGVMLLLFVFGHLAGNLQIFLGRTALNDYAAGLRKLGPLLWVARIGLLAAFLLHIDAAVRLTLRSQAARPVPYAKVRHSVTTYAARTMVISGILVVLYVLYHLMHFTWGWVAPSAYQLTEMVDGVARHDVYGMVVAGFQQPLIAIVYVVAQAVLAMHLSHGASSLMQTLGVRGPLFEGVKTYVGPAIALLVFVGYVSIPAAVLLGIVK